ncbi:MAG: hypothetical protein LBT47_00625 [Deltaproteobacteria bacterium]|jgi:hypothetical protein|nr:hypothetical protein [Deltaproteobacteria bacterium]
MNNENLSKFTVPFSLICLFLPPILMGPYLPLVDILIFVSLNSYPQLPVETTSNYYIVQYSYILVHLLVKFFNDIGIAPAWQVVLFYILQAGISYYIVRSLLIIFFQDKILIELGATAGLLTFWCGLFFWGGPLAYSLGYFVTGLGTVLIYREVDDGRDRTWKLTGLFFLALVSHPVVIILIYMNLFFRFIFSNKLRLKTVLLSLFLFAYCILIVRSSPEKGATLSEIFSRTDLSINISQDIIILFDVDKIFTERLLEPGSRFLTYLFFKIKSIIFLLGIASLAYVYLKKIMISKKIKLLSFNLLTVFAVYVLMPEFYDPSFMPLRFLAANWAVIFVGPLVLIGVIISHSSQDEKLKSVIKSLIFKPIYFFILFFTIITLALMCQIEVFKGQSDIFERQIKIAKSQIMTNQRDTVIDYGLHNIHPFYFRAVPFFVFIDKDIIDKNIYIITEWHKQYRHNIRFADADKSLNHKTYILTVDSNGDIYLK